MIQEKNPMRTITSESYVEKLLDSISDGFLLVRKDSGDILYMNEVWKSLLPQYADLPNWNKLLEPELRNEARMGNSFYEKVGGEVYQFKPVALGENLGIFVGLSNHGKVSPGPEGLVDAESINKELRFIFNNCSDEDIVICDGKGCVEFAGACCAGIGNMPKGFFVGKNVYDLEREGFFKPSVSVLVLESRMPQVTMQTTRDGERFVTVGVPVFDSEGNIEKVISLNTKYSDYNEKVESMARLKKESLQKYSAEDDFTEYDFITISDSLISVKRMLKMIADVNSTVLITGETGSGKERIARYLHSIGNRKNKPFIVVNCGSLPDSLAESELFGYISGAFTGALKEGKIGLVEAANGGVVFLDEIGELPLNQQVKLLRVLQDKVLTRVGSTGEIPVDIRVVAATNANLMEKVKRGEFREDLYFRLNVIPINVPPLRQRVDDIPVLARFFLKTYCQEHGVIKQFTSSAVEKLCQYSWPGNVRELDNVVEFLVVTNPKPYIEEGDLPEEICYKDSSGNVEWSPRIDRIIPLQEALDILERELIQMAVARYKNTTEAAKALGVNQSTISRKLAKYKGEKEKW